MPPSPRRAFVPYRARREPSSQADYIDQQIVVSALSLTGPSKVVMKPGCHKHRYGTQARTLAVVLCGTDNTMTMKAPSLKHG